MLFTIDSLQAGGAEKSTLDTIYHLAEQWEIIVVYFYAKHDLKPAFELAPCKLIYIPLESGYRFRKGVNALTKLIRIERIDLIVTSLYRSGIISRIAGKLTGVPIIDTIVNDGYSASKLAEFKGLHKLKFFVVKYIDKFTAGIPLKWISNSLAIAQSMGKSLQLNPAKINVIYRGRNSNEMPAWVAPTTSEGIRFIAAGRLVAQKGFADLINAFTLLLRDHPNCSLTIFGDGADRSILQKLIRDAGVRKSIQLPGRKPNVWKEFYDAHCFVLPSHYEGLSGVLIEALILGMPIVATDIPMNIEAAVGNASINFYKMGDVKELYKTLQHVLNEYNELALASADKREKAIARYDLKNIASQYNQILKEVVQKN